MDLKLQSLIYGGLLHDIGKLLQRADKIKTDHSSYGKEFISRDRFKIAEKESILNCIAYHHADRLKNSNLNNDNIAYIVFEADNIASGTDRRSNDGESEVLFDKEVNLKSVFNLLNVDKNLDKNGLDLCYPLRSLDEHLKINYPVPTDQTVASSENYAKLKRVFEENLESINYTIDNPNSLLNLLEASVSYIPSSTNTAEVADISLFDHLKITSAVASCMYLYFKDNDIKDYKRYCFGEENSKFRDEKSFLMASGDLSGIQNFIYTVSSKGALKSLRARSFYLDLIMEHIIDEIFEKLGISRANLLYVGGGHFYMLLPYTKDAVEVLENAKQQVNERFLKMYFTSLYIEIATVPCSCNDLMNPPDTKTKMRSNKTGEIFKELSRRLAKRKLHRYNKEQLRNISDPDGKYSRSLNNTQECSICHTSSNEIVEFLSHVADESDRVSACVNCRNFFDIGGKLIDPMSTDSVIIGIRKEKSGNSVAYLELPDLTGGKKYLYLENFIDAIKNMKNDPKYYCRLYSINTMMTGITMSTNLWMGNYSKKSSVPNKIVDFSEFVKNAKGIERLAVLRADVDDLGRVFTSGLQNDDSPDAFKYATISRYAAFSRHLSLFFKRYINNISKGQISGEVGCEKQNFLLSPDKPAGEKNIAVVYSGGDDVFIVGAWSDVIEFAVDMRSAFLEYTGGKLTFSGGLGFFKSGFPVLQMARLTHELEKVAKSNPDKDSIALFGFDFERDGGSKHFFKTAKHVYKWDDFIDKVYLEKFRFIQESFYFKEVVNKNGKPNEDKIFAGNSFLYKLLELFNDEKEKYSRGKSRINIARLAYVLARIEPPKDVGERALQNYKKVREKIYGWISNDKDRAEFLTALNLIIYLNRENGT